MPPTRSMSISGHSLQMHFSTLVNPDKVYLETAKGDFKKLYYNHMKSLRNK